MKQMILEDYVEENPQNIFYSESKCFSIDRIRLQCPSVSVLREIFIKEFKVP